MTEQLTADDFDIPDTEPDEWSLDDKLSNPPKLVAPQVPDRETPTGNWVTELAFETALGYYSPDQLMQQFDLRPSVFEKVQSLPDFQRAVAGYQREIDDEGIAFKLRARRSAALLLDELTFMAFDSNLDAKDRLKAIEMVAKYAGFGVDSTKNEEGTKIIIQTNLNLNNKGSEKGVYTIDIPHDTPLEAPE